MLTWGLAASMILAVGVIFNNSDNSEYIPSAAISQVARVSGDEVRVAGTGSDRSRPVVGSDLLTANQTVRTGPRSRAAINWGNGGSLRIDENSEVELVAADRIRLLAGAVYFDSTPDAGNASDPMSFSVETPYGLVTHVGTQFATRLHRNVLTLSVREGEVVLATTGRRFSLPAGDEFDIGRNGVTAERKVKAFGDHWHWAEDIAPSFGAEGRSAQELLAWIGRETGHAKRRAVLNTREGKLRSRRDRQRVVDKGAVTEAETIEVSRRNNPRVIGYKRMCLVQQ
jgi:hypothetical protein